MESALFNYDTGFPKAPSEYRLQIRKGVES